MFRILFIFFILGVSLYGLYWVFSPLNKAQSVAYFDEYLSGALERNSGDSSLYTVTFNRNEFLDENAVQWMEESSAPTQKDTNIRNTSSTDHNSLIIINNNNTNQQNTANTWTFQENNINSIQWSFGTPELPNISTWFSSNSDCSNGLIFDPCLALSDPIPASGNMYFWSDKG